MIDKQNSLLEIRDLSFFYKGRRRGVSDINLSLEGGQIIGLLGPNGSGKTTLLKLLAGMLQKASGEILLDGRPFGIASKAETAYLPDREFFGRWMKLEDILDFYTAFFRDFDREKAVDFLRCMDLKPKDSIKTMSLGERERVAAAMTMSRRVRLYLLDEPIAAVDPAMRELVFRTIIRDFPENAIVLMSTHLVAEAEPLMDKVLFMEKGRVKAFEDTELLRSREQKSVDQYFREVYAWF